MDVGKAVVLQKFCLSNMDIVKLSFSAFLQSGLHHIQHMVSRGTSKTSYSLGKKRILFYRMVFTSTNTQYVLGSAILHKVIVIEKRRLALYFI